MSVITVFAQVKLRARGGSSLLSCFFSSLSSIDCCSKDAFVKRLQQLVNFAHGNGFKNVSPLLCLTQRGLKGNSSITNSYSCSKYLKALSLKAF